MIFPKRRWKKLEKYTHHNKIRLIHITISCAQNARRQSLKNDGENSEEMDTE